MSEQPGDLLDEAVKLFETLRRRLGGEAGPAGGGGADERAGGRAGEDVWSRVVAEEPRDSPESHEPRRSQEPHEPGGGSEPGGRGEPGASRESQEPPRIATGAPECLDCPVCQAIAMARRASGEDVREHLRQAGRSLVAAAQEIAAAFERTRSAYEPPRAGPDGDRSAGGR